MSNENDHVHTILECGTGHRHELCVAVRRGVPPELRCSPNAAAGYGQGDGGCAVPRDLNERVERALRDDMVEERRQGFVLIRE